MRAEKRTKAQLIEELAKLQAINKRLEKEVCRHADAAKTSTEDIADVEYERTQEEAERARRAFWANVSHEIRTPLNAILGYAQLLQDKLELTGESRQNMEGIRNCTARLLALLHNMPDGEDEWRYLQVQSSKVVEQGRRAGSLDNSFNGVVLPIVLRARLCLAAEMHNVTELKRCLEKLQNLGEAETQLAMHLGRLVQEFDLRSVLEILENTAAE